MESEPKESDMLRSLLDGDASPDVLDAIASSAKEDSALASRVRDELGFSEMIRQVLHEDRDHPAERFEEALDAVSLSLEELMERVCDGRVTQPECDRLVRLIWEEPEKVSALRKRLAVEEWISEAASSSRSDEAFIEALETRMWAQTRRDHFVEDFQDRLDRELAVQEAPDNIIEFPTFGPRTVAKMASVAAAIAVGAFFAAQMITDRTRDGEVAATVVKESSDVVWAEGSSPGADGSVKSGQYSLESGIVSLQFPSGGEMTVEGPALFDIEEGDSAFVYHGVAMAKAASADMGISLRSKGLSVAEPVPLIGIDARSEFSTEAVMFSGGGGVCLKGGGCRDLYEREAIKADLTRDKLVDIPYNPRPFAKTWEVLAGVEQNMGSVRIELPGTEVQPATRKGEVQVFVENESFLPESDLEVDHIEVGQFALAASNPGESLQSEGNLRSYLLQVWPTEGEDQDEVEASLTFDHPVVGVIFSSDRLASSDESVGTSISHLGEDFNQVRGLDSETDQLLLSDDRRTLNLKFRSGNLEIDQVRVLVALN
jgi:hypothetical protein